jgi:hypothetical protein
MLEERKQRREKTTTDRRKSAEPFDELRALRLSKGRPPINDR